MTVFLRRLAYLLRRGPAERELAEELQFHREMVQRELHRPDMSNEETVRAVNGAMGNMLHAQEDVRAVWTYPWLESLWQDLCHGVRSLRRSPGLVVISALSLGLGIGVNSILYMGGGSRTARGGDHACVLAWLPAGESGRRRAIANPERSGIRRPRCPAGRLTVR